LLGEKDNDAGAQTQTALLDSLQITAMETIKLAWFKFWQSACHYSDTL